MKNLVFILAVLVGFSSQAAKISIEVQVNETLTVDASNPNRYNSTSTTVFTKASGRIQGQHFNQSNVVTAAGDGSYILIGSDEVTEVNKEGKQTITPANIASDRIVYQTSSASAKFTVNNASGKVKISKTVCNKESTSVMKCSTFVSATARG